MAIQRISTFSIHQRTLTDVNRVQSDLFDKQKQLSSGFTTDTFGGIQGQVEQFTFLEAKIRKSDTYIEDNSVVLSRLNTSQTTLDKIIDISDKLEDLMTLWRNPTSTDGLNFSQQADALRKTAVTFLNSTFEGKFLFSGTRTDVPPVIEPVPDPVAEGVPDDGYYQGSNDSQVLRAQDNYEMEYSVRANESGFQKMLAAVSLSITADSENSDDKMAQALDMLQEGLDEIVAIQTRVNSNIVTLNDINQQHTDLKLYWKGVSEGIINTDIVKVSSSVAVDQAVLQATFQAFAGINRLRLVDFL
jgi:flagellar hook-associated protein 3 FlgL